jgi:hypothetical protein
LFAESTAELKRKDPWSGNNGFLLVDMGLRTRDDLAEQYFDAAPVLIVAVIPPEQDFMALILYGELGYHGQKFP